MAGFISSIIDKVGFMLLDLFNITPCRKSTMFTGLTTQCFDSMSK